MPLAVRPIRKSKKMFFRPKKLIIRPKFSIFRDIFEYFHTKSVIFKLKVYHSEKKI